MVSKLRRRMKKAFSCIKNSRTFSRSKDDLTRESVKATGFYDDIFGHKMYANVTDVAIHLEVLQGVPISQHPYGEIGYCSRMLKRGQTVVDLGANIGFFTLLFARQVGPEGKVYAFEPGPISYALLTANVRINGYHNVVLVNKAVSSRTEMQTLYLCPTGESDNRVSDRELSFESEHRTTVPIEAVRLDDFFAELDDPVDYLKIDIQGGEYLAFLGMEQIIKRNPQMRIVMEFSPRGLQSIGPKEFIDYITRMGFVIYDLLESAPPFRADYEYLYGNYISSGKMTNLVLSRDRS